MSTKCSSESSCYSRRCFWQRCELAALETPRLHMQARHLSVHSANGGSLMVHYAVSSNCSLVQDAALRTQNVTRVTGVRLAVNAVDLSGRQLSMAKLCESSA